MKQIILAVLTAIIVIMPARADVIGDEIFLSHCAKITNLEKFPDHQIIARVYSIQKRFHEPTVLRGLQDVAMQPSSCVSLFYKYELAFYAVHKSELKNIDLTKIIDKDTDPRISGLDSPQIKLIPSDLQIPYYYKYTGEDSNLPWYVSDVQEELQIIDINPSVLKLQQKTIYHNYYLFWALAFAATLVLIITLIFRRIWKIFKSFDP
jgi:hypothetical protein